MPHKCDFCGEKVKNGVCTGCGMNYDRGSASSADTSYEQPHTDNAAQTDNNESDLFSKAFSDGIKRAKKTEKTGIIIGIVLSLVLSAAVIIYGILSGTFFEDAKREADRRAEQAITERHRITIPDISIPHVDIPRITVPDIDFGEDIQKALDHDIQSIIGQNGENKE